MNKMFEKMKEYHKYIFDMFDLGSSLTISITIFNDEAIVTNSNQFIWGKECKKTEVGSKLAETILLNLESYRTEFGNWISPQSLPHYKEILKLKEENFEMPLSLMKLWQVARIICNVNEKNKIYQIDYYSEADTVDVREFKDEKEINQFFEDYII